MDRLTDYLDRLGFTATEADVCMEEDPMRKLKKYAQVDVDGQEGLYETTIDRWSRNAKHHLAKSEIAGVTDLPTFDQGDMVVYEGQECEVKIPQGPKNTVGIMHEGHLRMVHQSRVAALEEGVMGGVQTMSPINRIMQLAGLEHTGSVATEVVEEEIIEEDGAGTMFDQLLAKNESDPSYKNNPNAARVATIGQVLAGMQRMLDDLPDGLDLQTSVITQLKMVPGIGANLIKAAQMMTKPEGE